MKLISTFVSLFSLLATVETYSIGQTCKVNTDCDSTSTDVYCRYEPRIRPACAKGICTCKYGYVHVFNKCVATKSISLNAACNGTGNEIYPYGAFCLSSRVKCYDPIFYESGGVCLQTPMAGFNETCQVSPSLRSLTCNSSASMTCDSWTLRCVCYSNHLYKSSSSECVYRTYGDSCSTSNECDTGYYTQSSGGGASCINRRCGCSRGYTKVDRLGYLPGDESTTKSIPICMKNYTTNVGSEGDCTLFPEFESNTGARLCSSSLLCFRCPENIGAANLGKCVKLFSRTREATSKDPIDMVSSIISIYLRLSTFLISYIASYVES